MSKGKYPAIHRKSKIAKTDWTKDVEPALYLMRLDVSRKLNLTLYEFANLLGYGIATVRKWENNLEYYYEDFGVDRILRLLSMFYNIPLEEFENADRLTLYYGQHMDEIVDHISKLKLRG